MKQYLALLFFCAPGFAAVTGTVVNRTTGQPAAGATVGFYKLGQQNGLELVDQAKTDAAGAFSINRTPEGPSLLRTAFDGVTYNHMLPPGSPASGLNLEVYNASKQPGGAKVSKHMILFEPNGAQVTVRETYLFNNAGKTAWNDPEGGTLRFFLPAAAGGKAEVNATAPGGMPIGAALVKSSRPDTAAVDFPIKPGETRFDIAYSIPYTEGAALQGKILTKDENTYLIAPNGVTLAGAGLNDLGLEPQTQAHIWGLDGAAYDVTLSGAEAATPAAAESADGGSDGSPQIEEIMPHMFGQAKLILALALGILALGFVILYRTPAPAAKEPNERGRR